jgi:DNA-binding CsgD family transcriptional regulator
VGRLVLAGETNEAIAKTLFMSERTVKRHRQTAFEKLGAKNTAEFVLLAYQCGL